VAPQKLLDSNGVTVAFECGLSDLKLVAAAALDLLVDLETNGKGAA
jgi:hypothetical protein